MPAVFERVRKIIADQLGVEETEINPTTSFVEDLNADSLDLVELIMERNASSGFGSSTYAGASIGQGIFAALLIADFGVGHGAAHGGGGFGQGVGKEIDHEDVTCYWFLVTCATNNK